MSQVVTRKTRSRKTSFVADMDGSPTNAEKQSSVIETLQKLPEFSALDLKNMSEREGAASVMKKALVIDDIIDNFHLDESVEENNVVDVNRAEALNGVKNNENIEKENDSDSYIDDDIDEDEEDLEEEINDDEEYVQPFTTSYKGPKKTGTASVKQPEIRYGKLWEFIRDLLKNEKYNPKIITWEDIEKGEFRIVDSVLVAKLWATVKKNKKMNYEKLSRAMRYYYKQNIFGIVENKRLVYRFGSKAKNWKPVSGGGSGSVSPPDRRCYNCLRLLESGPALKRHAETCATNIIIPGNNNKNGIKVVQVQPKHQIQPEENKKRLSQKLNEIKAKEREDEQYQKISKEFHRKIQLKEEEKRKIELRTLNPPKEEKKSLLEDLESKSKIEKEALETLMALGTQPSPARSPTGNSPVIPTTKALSTTNLEVVSPPNAKQLLSNPADKILFLKSASEKSKTQTILQKRTENVSPIILANSCNLIPGKYESDDEVEIVDVVKHKDSNDRIEAAAETVVKNQRMSAQKSNCANNENFARKSPSPTKVFKALNVIQTNPASPTLLQDGKLPSRGKSIKINPKYSNLLPKRLTTAPSTVPITPPVEQQTPLSLTQTDRVLTPTQTASSGEVCRPTIVTSIKRNPLLTPPSTPTGSVPRPSLVTASLSAGKVPQLVSQSADDEEAGECEPAKKMIRINPKYSNFVAGKKPEDCGNIAGQSIESPESEGRLNIKINPKYQKQTSLNILSSDCEVVSAPNGKGPPPSYEMAVTSNPHQAESSYNDCTTKVPSNITLNPKLHQSIAPSSQSNKSPTLTTLLRNTKICDIRAAMTSRSPDKTEDSVPALSNLLKRRHSDTANSQPELVDLGEPIPNLWKFIRALLHNPNYNPKLVAWENLEEGIFRIHNLQDFYNVWKLMKSTTINYDLWVKTVKLYDERRILHSLEGHRCVYKFGVKASQWKPLTGEVIMAGKRHFPNQATWPVSRFYSEFNTAAITQQGPGKSEDGSNNAGVTTLFTLRPLDTSLTSMSELKVMSDNSSILIPSDSRKNIIYSGPKTPIKRIKLTESKGSEGNSENKAEETQTSQTGPSAAHSLEVDCKLTLPVSPDQKAVLTFPNGDCLKLDRSLFSLVEKKIKKVDGSQQVRNIMKNNAVNEEKTKLHREASILKALMSQENPVTHEQLREAVVPKSPQFTKSSMESGKAGKAGNNVRKLPIILPKPTPAPRHLPDKRPVKETPLYTSSQSPETAEVPAITILPSCEIQPPPAQIPAETSVVENKKTVAVNGIEAVSENKKEDDESSEESSDFELNDDGSCADDEAETLYIDDEAAGGHETVRRENVVRCKLYRDNKKMEQKNCEKELSDLECKHIQLKATEEFLDKSIEALHKFYINLISKNTVECPCEDEKGEKLEVP